MIAAQHLIAAHQVHSPLRPCARPPGWRWAAAVAARLVRMAARRQCGLARLAPATAAGRSIIRATAMIRRAINGLGPFGYLQRTRLYRHGCAKGWFDPGHRRSRRGHRFDLGDDDLRSRAQFREVHIRVVMLQQPGGNGPHSASSPSTANRRGAPRRPRFRRCDDPKRMPFVGPGGTHVASARSPPPLRARSRASGCGPVKP